ncbi:c-type cytochrome biogenesis protein CcsB [Derxia lacustris]|uniref:c-type cytochrome biogenesis protein CcsB n=1 Tax=Derxia lacustris TaxID=764842 RepID=UPI000A1765EA|nr:c-type cytochrome biogenesis protein CcsB [Derxia lacustris]
MSSISPHPPATPVRIDDFSEPSYLARRDLTDWLFAAAIVAATVFAFVRFGAAMDYYEKVILVGAAIAVTVTGWGFRPLRLFVAGLALLSYAGIAAYGGFGGGDLSRADTAFVLKFFLASQSAILWMCALFFLATVTYWIGIAARSDFVQRMGSWFTWAATLLGFTGLMLRWYESHQMGEGIGHIPVSNLYEVFVLFSLITALFYLHYERRYLVDNSGGRALGGFVLLVISSAVGFLLWYSFDRGAHEIQPLVPALQSWWMKIHVPANFIGYGTFSLAAMVAYAYLIKQSATTSAPARLVPLFLFGVLLGMEPLVFRIKNAVQGGGWVGYVVVGVAASAALVGFRKRIAAALPSFEVLDDIMYKAIAVGFAFFTIATILGALWAADAWGAYWQWDPKETWALIVWLNYAAWLHLRLMKGLRGTVAAWWALIGLLITGFAFLGVNMFLSGLHSYGQL